MKCGVDNLLYKFRANSLFFQVGPINLKPSRGDKPLSVRDVTHVLYIGIRKFTKLVTKSRSESL